MPRFNLRKTKWLLFLFFAISNGQFNNQRGHPTSFDKSKELSIRHETTERILKYMNTEGNPCKDFLDFACGNWIEKNAPSHAGDSTTFQSEIEMRSNQDLQLLLSEPHKQSTISERKVLNFYESCVGVESTSPAQNMFMTKFVRELGGIASMPSTNWHNNYNWLNTAAKLRSRYGLDVIIGFEKGTNLETMREEVIYLGEPKTTIISPENCSAAAMETISSQDDAYEALQEEISGNMQRWLSMSESDAKRFGGDIIRFEIELCKKMRMEESMPEVEERNEFSGNSRQMNNMGQNRLYGRRVIGELPRYGVSQLSQFDSTINFKDYVVGILGPSYNEQVFIRSEQYLKHMARVTRAAERATIANYLMYLALSTLNFPSDDRSTNRRAYCVQQVQNYFPKIAGAMYSRQFFQRNNMGQDVVEYFNEITKSLDKSLDAEWITEQTRRAARQKLLQIKSRFPVYQNLDLNDLQIEQQGYWQKLVAVMQYNANNQNTPDTIESFDARTKLMPLENEVLVGLALLQLPFYDNYLPRAMKYAALGHRLARELALAFDEQGWRPSSASNQLLDEYTAEGLKNRTECYRTQYSNYLTNNPEEFHNTSRLREIIADSNGLNLAFNAYLNWLDSVDPRQSRGTLKRETLSTLNFTNTQLFFIHFAQSRCAAKYGEESASEILPMDRHTPERYDVNGPLANFVEFAREFGCSPGEEMSPDDKCVIY